MADGDIKYLVVMENNLELVQVGKLNKELSNN